MIVSRIFDALINFSKPALAAVDCDVHGAGLAHITLCDMVLTTDNATFSMPRKHWRSYATVLCRAIGQRAARRIYIDGWIVNSEDAAAIGLVHKVIRRAAVPQSVGITSPRTSSIPRGISQH